MRVVFAIALALSAASCRGTKRSREEVVPFEFIHWQIVLTASVGNTPDLHFLLDTGTDPSAIDLNTAERLGLPLDTSKSGEASGVGAGHTKVHSAQITGLRIGSVEIPPIEALAMDLSALSQRVGLRVCGILGYSFLQGRTVEIDYPHRVLRLLPNAPAYRSDALEVPLRIAGDDRTPILEGVVHVNGRSLPVTLDTGSSLTLEIFPNARKVLGSDPWEAKGGTGMVLGARGDASVRHVDVDSIAIGRWTLETRDLVISDRSGEDGPRMGNLGNRSLATFVLTLDYRNGMVIFARPPDPAMAPAGQADRPSQDR